MHRALERLDEQTHSAFLAAPPTKYDKTGRSCRKCHNQTVKTSFHSTPSPTCESATYEQRGRRLLCAFPRPGKHHADSHVPEPRSDQREKCSFVGGGKHRGKRVDFFVWYVRHRKKSTQFPRRFPRRFPHTPRPHFSPPDCAQVATTVPG